MFHDDENLDPSRPLDCREDDLAASKLDMIKSISWGGWIARAKIEEGFYAVGQVDEVSERKLFEIWYHDLTDERA